MLAIRCCSAPQKPEGIRLPKRVARARRVMESKRLDSFKEIHEALKKTAKEEQAFIRDFFDKTRDMWRDDTEEAAKDEALAENEEL